MRKSLFSKIFFTQIIVNLTIILLIIPTLFFIIGDYFVSTHKEAILQDAMRVASLSLQIADVGGDESTWAFFRSGIEFVSGQSNVLVTNSDGEIIASPKSPSGVNLGKIDKSFIK